MKRPRACRAFAGALALFLAACAAPRPQGDAAPARAFPEGEALFRQDARWLGSDAALSVPLGPGRTLWLFGDTFLARPDQAAPARTGSTMVRNTVAVQEGLDPLRGKLTFHWRRAGDGAPAAFFPDQGARGFWPGHGIRLAEGPLIVFLYGIVATPGQGLGFAGAGWALAVIENPDAAPEEWAPRVVDAAPSAFDAVPATAVVRDGPFVVALAIRQEGTHQGALVRYSAAALARGNLNQAEWWAGEGRGWLTEGDLGPAGPEFVLDDAGSECSLHWDARLGRFVHVASYGFGATEIGLRTAPALTGPWTPPAVVFRPPESDGPRPFVYAAKAHPELSGPEPEDLIVTYATNSFEFADLFTAEGEQSIYWPRFVLVRPAAAGALLEPSR